MKRVTANGVQLAYEERGSGPETVVLSHSFLVDHRQFGSQIDVLSKHFRVLAYDHRGHGASDRPSTGYEMESIYQDGLRFIEATGAAPCHFVGLSTGGFVGLRLAIRRPELLRSVVLMDTSAGHDTWTQLAKYNAMFAILLVLGYGPLMGATMPIMFGPTFLNDPARQEEVALWRQRIMANDRKALVRFGRGIFSRDSVMSQIAEIRLPTLVMVGEHDRAQPPNRSERMVEGIDGAQMLVVPQAGHVSTVDNPDFVDRALLSFFETGRADVV